MVCFYVWLLLLRKKYIFSVCVCVCVSVIIIYSLLNYNIYMQTKCVYFSFYRSFFVVVVFFASSFFFL